MWWSLAPEIQAEITQLGYMIGPRFLEASGHLEAVFTKLRCLRKDYFYLYLVMYR